jgi:hypothetical protein
MNIGDIVIFVEERSLPFQKLSFKIGSINKIIDRPYNEKTFLINEDLVYFNELILNKKQLIEKIKKLDLGVVNSPNKDNLLNEMVFIVFKEKSSLIFSTHRVKRIEEDKTGKYVVIGSMGKDHFIPMKYVFLSYDRAFEEANLIALDIFYSLTEKKELVPHLSENKKKGFFSFFKKILGGAKS